MTRGARDGRERLCYVGHAMNEDDGIRSGAEQSDRIVIADKIDKY